MNIRILGQINYNLWIKKKVKEEKKEWITKKENKDKEPPKEGIKKKEEKKSSNNTTDETSIFDSDFSKTDEIKTSSDLYSDDTEVQNYYELKNECSNGFKKKE